MSNTIETQDVNSTTVQNQTDEIRVEVVQETDTEEILNMLKTYFFKVHFSSTLNQDWIVGDIIKKNYLLFYAYQSAYYFRTYIKKSIKLCL